MAGAIAVPRGCGTRKAGGVYAELGLSGDGVPLESFLMDPPRPVDNLGFPITAVGVTAFEKNGVTHVLDWIGSQYYPNVPDVIEEVRRFGLSRRIGAGFDFSQLGPKSRILCVHQKAWVEPMKKMRDPEESAHYCPLEIDAHHQAESPQCLGASWEHLVEGEPVEVDGDRPHLVALGHNPPIEETHLRASYRPRLVKRHMPSFSYYGFEAPDGLSLTYRPAIFASFPISRLTVVRDPSGGKHESAAEKASTSSLDVELVDE